VLPVELGAAEVGVFPAHGPEHSTVRGDLEERGAVSRG